jgi:Domain of unknown function (DUF4336)
LLEPICDAIWCASSGMYLPGKLMHFSLRMTVVRLADNKLLLISPIALDDTSADELRALGEVAYIIAPNTFHHLHAGTAKARFPGAKLFAARGIAKKRPDLAIDGVLDDSQAQPWQAELLTKTIRGCPGFNETVFFHRTSGTLIVTDLVFNVHTTKGLLTGLFLRLVGAHKRFAQSRAWRMVVKDRAAAKASVLELLELDITRVVMAHGEIVVHDCKPALHQALRWILSA